METCVREKYNLLFPWNLMKFIFFLYPWKEKVVSVKILTISLYHVHEKENPPVKISKNASVKNLECPWKSVKKCAWKPHNVSWKKSKKGRRRLSRALFIFTKKKSFQRGKRHDNLFLEVGKNIEKRNNNLYNLKFQILTNPRKNVKSMKT